LVSQDKEGAQPVRSSFSRKVVDIREVFHDALSRYLVEGEIADKEKLEEDKLKISAGLVNFVVSGGVLLFRDELRPGEEESADNGKNDMDETVETVESVEASLDDKHLDEISLFRLLRKTILLMLNELNKPDVNLLKISLIKSFRESIQSIFSEETGGEPDRFPMKIFHDIHPNHYSYIGINMRNTRSLGDDIDRIERDPALRREITKCTRPSRHTDGNLLKILGLPTSQKESE
jgi:hypothetical protein